MSRPLTWDHLKSQKKAERRSVVIPLDGDLADRYTTQKFEVERLRLRAEARPDEPEIHQRLDEQERKLEGLRAELDENSVEFIFKSIGRQRFEDLILSNPPTSDQRKDAKKRGDELNFNPDTFPPSLIARSIVSPEMDEAAVKEMWVSDEWSSSECQALFMTALEANSSRRLVDLGNG